MSTFQPIAISLDGSSITLTREQAVEQIGSTYRRARGADTESLKAWCRLGSILLQLRPRFAYGRWGPFLKSCGIEHLQQVNRAIRTAEECADRDGHLDRAKVEALFKAYNEAHPDFKALDAEHPNIRQVQIATGHRKGTPQTPASRNLSSGISCADGGSGAGVVDSKRISDYTNGRVSDGAKWREAPPVDSYEARYRADNLRALGEDDDEGEGEPPAAIHEVRDGRGPGRVDAPGASEVDTNYTRHGERAATPRTAAREPLARASSSAEAMVDVPGQLTLDNEYGLARERVERMWRDPELVKNFNRWWAEKVGG